MPPAGSGEKQRSRVHTSGTSAAYLARRIISPASTPPTLTLGCICGHTASSVSSVCRWNSSGKTCVQAGRRQRARISILAANPCLDHRVHQVRLGDIVFAVDDLLQDARQHGCLIQLQVYAFQLAQHLQRTASAGRHWAVRGVAPAGSCPRGHAAPAAPSPAAPAGTGERRSGARLAERDAGQRRTLSREGPWCCMRTQSLFICWQACKSAALPQPRLHRPRLREVLQNKVHSILWVRRRRSTVSQASRERGTANVPGRCRHRPRTPSRCPAAGFC